jgi:signal transduction histidine kinase
VAALAGFCREFAVQHNLQVQYVHQDVSEQVPKDVSLCLFRILQEALRNVVKHSGAAEAKVELSYHGDGIELCISDSGSGFDPAFAKGDGGLGLISMRERLRLVGGHLSIESEVPHGTRIHVRIPVSGTAGQGTGDAKRYGAKA